MSEVMKIARKLVKQGYLEHDEYARLLANRNDKVRRKLRLKTMVMIYFSEASSSLQIHAEMIVITVALGRATVRLTDTG